MANIRRNQIQYIERDLHGRHTNAFTTGIQEEFDKTYPFAGWAFAGAPFVTPVTAQEEFGSFFRCSNLGSAAGRAFYHLSGPSTGHAEIRVFYLGGPNNAYVGLRWDDGTDNNYVEVLWTHIATGTFSVQVADRAGGGARNVATSATWNNLAIDISQHMLIGEKSGPYHTSWNVTARVGSNWGGHQIYTGPGAGGGFAWTPSRCGFVMCQGGVTNATWNNYMVHNGTFNTG